MRPAQVIKKFPEIGTLSEGKVADIAVLALREGVFAFKDSWNVKRLGEKKLEAVATIRNGALVFDAEGRAFPEWTTAGDYEVIR
jgi:predicted amidohydrolase